MDRLGYLKEFERKCDEFLGSNVELSVERMEERDKLIRLAKSAVKSRVVSNAEVKSLIEHLDEALFSQEETGAKKSYNSLEAKSTVKATPGASKRKKVSSFNHGSDLDKRWL